MKALTRQAASSTKRNAIYAQSGGATAFINATACGVLEAARRYRSRIGRVLAGRDGIIGVLSEDLTDTSKTRLPPCQHWHTEDRRQ